MLEPPPEDGKAKAKASVLVKGPNIKSLPRFEPMPDELELPVLLSAPDNISTDEILPAGMRVLPYRSNILKISEFAFEAVDPTYVERAEEVRAYSLAEPGKFWRVALAFQRRVRGRH